MACEYLPDMSSKSIWRAIRHTWIYIYTGSPEIFHVNQGSNFVCDGFHQEAATEGIEIKEAPVESFNLLGIFERAYPVFKAVIAKIEL